MSIFDIFRSKTNKSDIAVLKEMYSKKPQNSFKKDFETTKIILEKLEEIEKESLKFEEEHEILVYIAEEIGKRLFKWITETNLRADFIDFIVDEIMLIKNINLILWISDRDINDKITIAIRNIDKESFELKKGIYNEN